MILRLLFVILILFSSKALSISLMAQKATDWKLARQHKHIKIYLRKHEGSALKEVLGIMEIKASLSAIVSLIKDTENHHKWMYANKTSRVLESAGNFEWVLHTESKAPWPVANRDMISRVKMKQNLKTCGVRIEAEGIPDYIPPNKNLVRIKKMHSVWELTPKNGGITEVKLEFLIDLGGNIPIWLVNLAVDKGPYNTLSGMSETLKNKKYQNIRLPYLKESCP